MTGPAVRTPPAPSRAIGIVTWVLTVLVAVEFLFAGGTKLVGTPEAVKGFEGIGGTWFRLFTGVVELVGAIALLVPRTFVLGFTLLVCTMIGALYVCLVAMHVDPKPAAITLVLLLVIGWLRRNRLAALLKR